MQPIIAIKLFFVILYAKGQCGYYLYLNNLFEEEKIIEKNLINDENGLKKEYGSFREIWISVHKIKLHELFCWTCYTRFKRFNEAHAFYFTNQSTQCPFGVWNACEK